MKMNLLRAALAGAALAFTSTAAFATVTPISGTPVGLDHDPAGIIASAPTNADGKVTFRNLLPGKYTIIVQGKGLVAAIERLAPSPKKTSGGPSVSIGGLLGGGHSGTGHSENGHPSSSHSGGGAGVGIDIPLSGGDKGDDRLAAIIGGNSIIVSLNLPEGGSYSVTMPYCPDNAGAAISFTVPEGGGTVVLGIAVVTDEDHTAY